MKLIRHILSHGLLIAFLISLGLAYYYRTLLFSESVNQQVDNNVNSVLIALNLAPAEQPPTEKEEQEEQEEVVTCESLVEESQSIEVEVVLVEEKITDAQEIDAREIVAEDALTEEVIVEHEQITEHITEQEIVETESNELTSGESLPVEISPVELLPVEQEVVVESSSKEVSKEKILIEEQVVEQVTEQDVDVDADVAVAEDVPAPSVEAESPASRFDLINQARLLYQNGHEQEAIAQYIELSKAYPDDPNLFGELGNIYYSAGNWQQAAETYYEAAIRLKQQGKHQQINYLFRVIQGLDPEIAENLSAELGR